MKLVSKDGDFTIVKMPKADLDSLVRFVAHSVEHNSNFIVDLCQKVVNGDLAKQDEFVEQLKHALDISDWSIVLNKKDALNLCDDLADAIYDELPIHMASGPEKKEPHLKVVKVCVHCHKGFVKGESHDCVVF